MITLQPKLWLTTIVCQIITLCSSAQQSKECIDCCCKEESASLCIDNATHNLENNGIIIFDFKTKNIFFPKDAYKFKRGSAIRIKVINLNPFLYQVNIDGRDSSAKAISDNNNLLSAFTNLSNLNTLVAGLSGSIGVPGANSTPATNNTRFMSYNVGQENRKPKSNKEKAEIKKKNEKLKEIFNQNKKKINKWNDEFNSLKKNINEAIYKWDHLFASQRQLYPSCESFETIANAGGTIKSDFDLLVTNLSDDVKQIRFDIENYTDSLIMYNELIIGEGQDENRATDSLIKANYQAAFSSFSFCDSLLNYKLLASLEQLIDRMKDVRPCYLSNPIFFAGDSRTISLGFKAWNDSLHLPVYNSINFEMPWTQRRVWGVSGGIYISSLHNQNYSNSPTDSSASHYRLVKDNTSPIEIGISALAYIAWKHNQTDVQAYNYWGFCFGGGMSIESSPKPRVLLGGTYVNGNTNRLMISAGFIGGFTEQLSDAYSTSVNYVAAQNGYMKKVFKPGIFVSVSYSFLN